MFEVGGGCRRANYHNDRMANQHVYSIPSLSVVKPDNVPRTIIQSISKGASISLSPSLNMFCTILLEPCFCWARRVCMFGWDSFSGFWSFRPNRSYVQISAIKAIYSLLVEVKLQLGMLLSTLLLVFILFQPWNNIGANRIRIFHYYGLLPIKFMLSIEGLMRNQGEVACERTFNLPSWFAAKWEDWIYRQIMLFSIR